MYATFDLFTEWVSLQFMQFACPALWFISHEPRKDTNSLYLQCFEQLKDPFLNSLRNIINSNSHSYRHFASLYVLITAHMICPTVGLLFVCGYQELHWKILAEFNKEIC